MSHKDKRWKIEFQVGDGDEGTGKRTELMTDQELDKASDHIASERAAGRQVHLHLATDQDCKAQKADRENEGRRDPERDRDQKEREPESHQQKNGSTDRGREPARNEPDMFATSAEPGRPTAPEQPQQPSGPSVDKMAEMSQASGKAGEAEQARAAAYEQVRQTPDAGMGMEL